MTPFTRRGLLQTGAAIGGAALVTAAPGTASAAITPPTIHSRASWGARTPTEELTINDYRPTVIVVHHMATANTSDTSLEAAYAMSRSRQNYHMSLGHPDVGDHFGVSRGGHITEGRAHSLPLLQEGGTRFVFGAHAAGGNFNSIGIENEGLYTDVAPPAELWASLVRLCAYICQQYQINPNTSSIVGHRQINSTACPGDVLFGMLPRLRAEVTALLGDDVPPPRVPVWPTLRDGAAGDPVRSLQYFLNQHGFETSTDSRFGPLTDAAVRAFQQANGLTVDGIVGPATWPVLVVTTRQGSTGHAVTAVQTQLTRHEQSVTVDGDFGPATAAAVRAFQTTRALTADGVAGPLTWKHFVG
ncbi:N-acetylmuramoyl-L-alanine amidase [Stackebrandtia soli]|uniref:peptidoglycan recognition protein family protein n=1 Tax=Stackebrandtia soli TaxID=1892856 RepID=UPI0039E948DA